MSDHDDPRNRPMDGEIRPGFLSPQTPGRSAIAYRSGTYGSFRQGMLRMLGREGKYLRDLNTRAPDDPAMALLDAWAVAGDALSFYAERIANEAYLPTARERLSVRALARLLDYELRPGKAAETWLSFELEEVEGAPESVPIAEGTRVNSVPGPEEHMVSFETVEPITAWKWLGAMRPRLTTGQTMADIRTRDQALLAGVESGLKQGDWLLLADGSRDPLKRAEKVVFDNATDTTLVDIADVPNPSPVRSRRVAVAPAPSVRVNSTGLQPFFVTGQIIGFTQKQALIENNLRRMRVAPAQVRHHLMARSRAPLPTGNRLFRFNSVAALFGHNKPPPSSGGDANAPTLGNRLPDGYLELDREYPEMREGSYVVFRAVGKAQPFITTVRKIHSKTMQAGQLVSRVTRFEIADGIPEGWHDISTRDITVLVDARELPLAELPVTVPVEGSELALEQYYAGLEVGRPVEVSGERSDLDGVRHTSVHIMNEVLLVDGRTVIELDSALPWPLKRDSVRINGNVARATHGESGGQPIGHGDASQAGQQFVLPVVPLTHIAAATESGIAPELSIRVDDIEWRHVETLREAGPMDRVYALSYREDGKVVVRFGDGEHGQRLPTGIDNVVAWWRKGLGASGMVRAGQLTLLMDKPQGVRACYNGVPSAGAADGEGIEEARGNAPLGVLTLGKVVTLRDYADYARGFAGIAKAHAAWVWSRAARSVFLTVTGVDGALPEDRDIANLRTMLAQVSDTNVMVTIVPHRPVWFRVEAGIRLVEGYLESKVFPAIEAALRACYDFEARALGQDVARSEVLATIQGVEGVDWIDIDAFYRGATRANRSVLKAAIPRSGRRHEVHGLPLGAELLALDPAPVDLRRIS